MNEYTKQVNEFLDVTQTTFKVEYLKNDLHFDNDIDKRDIYEIILSKGGRSFSFEFGQSITHSGKWLMDITANGYTKGQGLTDKGKKKAYQSFISWGKFCSRNKDFQAPTAYDVFTCLTKYDPGTFEDFCSEFGYDSDSRKAEKIYKAVKNEYIQLCTLYSNAELELMAEIQ